LEDNDDGTFRTVVKQVQEQEAGQDSDEEIGPLFMRPDGHQQISLMLIRMLEQCY
jgi:hypothetical protein